MRKERSFQVRTLTAVRFTLDLYTSHTHSLSFSFSLSLEALKSQCHSMADTRPLGRGLLELTTAVAVAVEEPGGVVEPTVEVKKAVVAGVPGVVLLISELDVPVAVSSITRVMDMTALEACLKVGRYRWSGHAWRKTLEPLSHLRDILTKQISLKPVYAYTMCTARTASISRASAALSSRAGSRGDWSSVKRHAALVAGRMQVE